MLEHVDRIQIAVTDRDAATQTFADTFGATKSGADAVRALAAKRTTLHAGTSEIELLEPDGVGPVQAFVNAWGEGLFAAGFSTNGVSALATRLQSKGVAFTSEGEQLFIAPDQTPGLRMVISPERARPSQGSVVRYVYEATNLIENHAAAADFYADRFGLDQSRFCPIDSKFFGYTGQLTRFHPPERLDRIELSQITDPQKAMGRFMTRRGGETLYMCYWEAEALEPIIERLDKRGARYTSDPERAKQTNMFLHPATNHGVLMGISRTNVAWSWSGEPQLAPPDAAAH